MSVNIFKNGILSKIAGAVGDAVPLINNFLTNQAGKGAADANTVYVLNNKIEEVNNSLSIKYDSNTDYVQVLVNGEWLNWEKANILDSESPQVLNGTNETSDTNHIFIVKNYSNMTITWNSYSGSSMKYGVYGSNNKDDISNVLRAYAEGINTTTLSITEYDYIKMRLTVVNYSYKITITFS